MSPLSESISFTVSMICFFSFHRSFCSVHNQKMYDYYDLTLSCIKRLVVKIEVQCSDVVVDDVDKISESFFETHKISSLVDCKNYLCTHYEYVCVDVVVVVVVVVIVVVSGVHHLQLMMCAVFL